MDGGSKTAVLPAAMAAGLWALIEAITGALAPEVRPLVSGFHVAFWAGAAAFGVLAVTGRIADLSVFQKKESLFLLLLGTGGYGFWLLQGLSLELTQPPAGRFLFYSSPVLMGLFSMFGAEAPGGKRLVLLLLGWLGALLVLGIPTGITSGGSILAASAAAGGWALCWAVYSQAFRRLGRAIEVMPAITIVLAGGAVCMLASCIAGRINIFALTHRQLLVCAATGALAGVGMFYLWGVALTRGPLRACAPMWYVAPLVMAGLRVWQGAGWPRWSLVAGVFVLALVLRGAIKMAGEQSKTLGDVLRGE